jgi:DNA-directed RNA polymerase subunit RPC12/RpoP
VPGDTKKARWCVPCSRQHEGAQSKWSNMCEDCGLKQATCGVPGDTKKARWCVPCSRQHEGAQSKRSNMCEDCGLKQASCGVPGDTKKARWCVPCSRQHEGAQPAAAVKSGVGVKAEVDGALAIEQLSTLSRASNRPTAHCELPMRGSFCWQSTASAHAVAQYNSCTLPPPRLNPWRQCQGQVPVGVPLQRHPPSSCVPWMGGAWVRVGGRGARQAGPCLAWVAHGSDVASTLDGGGHLGSQRSQLHKIVF